MSTAKRAAMNRTKETDQSLPPLVRADSDQAIKRNHVSFHTDAKKGIIEDSPACVLGCLR